MRRIGIHNLTLAFPPMSNQEAEWLWKDEEVRREVSNSKLYMIGQRKEAFFENTKGNEDSSFLIFDIVCGDLRINHIRLPIAQFEDDSGDTIFLEGWPKLFRISRGPEGAKDIKNECELVSWFTPDRLFTYYSRGEVEVVGLERFRPFTEFDLYYVGISKVGDSFSRLFETAHEKRSRILGNETQLTPTARLTDELTIFLFNVQDMQLITYNVEDILENGFSTDESIDPKILAADAEKAFIKIMKSEYNERNYPNYPISSDGLYKLGFDRYSFVINDCLSFKTPTARIRGACYNVSPSDIPDMIIIEGDNVELFTPEIMQERATRGDFSIKSAKKKT